MTRLDSDNLTAAVAGFVQAKETNLGLEVSLPVVYPNGQSVTVVVTREAQGRCSVHDAGAGSMYLAGVGLKMNKRLQERLTGLVKSYGCEYVAGRVSVNCDISQLPVAVVLVANASRTVGDEGRLSDEITAIAFDNEVAAMLRDIVGNRLRERESITANSGKTYNIGHIVLDTNLRAPIAFIETVTNDNAVPRRVAEFLDLRDEYPAVDREAVYDDRRVWGSHQLVLLGKVCNPVPFGQADNRLRAIAGR